MHLHKAGYSGGMTTVYSGCVTTKKQKVYTLILSIKHDKIHSKDEDSVRHMDNYKNMYYALFNAISDAIDEYKQRDYEKMLNILIAAQQTAEDEFIED